MYYDRSLDPKLVGTLMPGGPLTWLMEHVRSVEGRDLGAHLQFRRNRHERKHSGIQIYWGRTSPLEFLLQPGGEIRLTADHTYRDGNENLFSKRIPVLELRGLEQKLRNHLQLAKHRLTEPEPRRQAFLTGEAICHAGLMRRYGHGWRKGDRILLVDSELQIGFDNTSEKEAVNAEVRRRLGLSRSRPLPTKLDALGVLPTGDIALVEVKKAGGDIRQALLQAAVHMVRFSCLLAEGSLGTAICKLLEQKQTTGVLPNGTSALREAHRLVPWIAAPDQSADWPSGWLRAVENCDSNLDSFLSGLTLVRLSPRGRILDARAVHR